MTKRTVSFKFFTSFFVEVLEKAETDTEKFAALFLVPKLVKGADCDRNARMHLVEAMGYSFLGDSLPRPALHFILK